jgi:hypothetical protein
MVNGGTVNNWACLNFSQTSEREVIKFCDDLVAMCNRKGMVCAQLCLHMQILQFYSLIPYNFFFFLTFEGFQCKTLH